MRTKAPTLVWLLTALTCFLAGMAIVESRHQAVALPHPERARASDGSIETGTAETSEVDATGPTAPSIREPLMAPRIGDISVPLATGPIVLRMTRLVVPPRVELAPAEASGWTVV